MSIWTTGEERLLRERYATSTTAQMSSDIPRHSWTAIRLRAFMLGLSRKRRARLFEVDPIITALVEKRKQLGMAQDVAATAIGVVPYTLSRYERGHRLPNLRELQKWCDLMQMSLEVSDFDRKSLRAQCSPTTPQGRENEVGR